jgi:hypothetical protein
MGLPLQILDTLGSGFNFLTAGHSQVRFDVDVRNCCLKFSWWIQGWPPVVMLQHHDGVFTLFPLVSYEALYL